MKAKALLWLGGASFVLALAELSMHRTGHAAIDLLICVFFTFVPPQHV